jgi:biotin carboxyl carrier protein
MKERTAIIGDQRIALAWTEAEGTLQVTANGKAYNLQFRRLGGGAYWFGFEGTSAEAVVTSHDQGYEVSINGHHVLVEFFESSKRRHRQTTDASGGIIEVRAPMPGKVVRILVGPSDEVRPQQGIVVIEAMKMQNEIRSPRAGRIVELHVREGDAVRSGELVARVE